MLKAKRHLFILPILLLTFFISTTTSAMTNLSNNATTSIEAHIGKGHWTVIQAWASNCNICNKEMPGFVKKYSGLPNTKVIGISLDGNRRSAQQFVNRHGVNFPTLLSNTNEFDRYLRRVAEEKLEGTPTYMIFTPQGKLAGVQQGHIPFGSIYNFITKQ